MSGDDLDLARETERLRRENRFLKEERELLKGPRSFSRAKSREVQAHPWPCNRNAVSMRGEEHSEAFCSEHMCDVLAVSSRGLRARRNCPVSQRQRSDMGLLADIKEESRRIIGWPVSDLMKRDLANGALKMTIALRDPPKERIHHTDRGSQNCSHDDQKLLRKLSFKVSMSGKGDCYDTSAVKTFFKTIKAELIWRRSWQTREAAELDIFQRITGFYNPRRRHSSLGWKSPIAFEPKVT